MTITDPSATAASLIFVQYLGGGVTPCITVTVRDGGFAVVGRPRRQFRYVVFQ
jgi:hypothetical protein